VPWWILIGYSHIDESGMERKYKLEVSDETGTSNRLKQSKDSQTLVDTAENAIASVDEDQDTELKSEITSKQTSEVVAQPENIGKYKGSIVTCLCRLSVHDKCEEFGASTSE